MEDIQYNNNIIIIGAGSLSRELFSWNIFNKAPLNIVGFLDDEKKDLNNFGIAVPVIGNIDINNIGRHTAIVAVSTIEFKEPFFKEAKSKNIKLGKFIHDSVLLGLNTKCGEGLILFPNSIISCNVTIGDLVFVNCGSQIGHDVVIGDFTSIMANVDIGGGAHIGKNVFIGSNAVILPGVKIPDNTRIGAGSVVFKNIRESGSYFGNPAKKIL